MQEKALCILSGGMDSALATAIAKSEGYEIIALHFNYKQKTEQKELHAFRELARHYAVSESYEINLPFFQTIGASALTDSTLEVPTGGMKEGVPITYVPFRNGIFLSIAAALAEKHGASAIYIGVVEEDSSGYPDCTKSYIKKMEEAINLGTKERTKIELKMPLVEMSKAQIVKRALALNVPLESTWSCYKSEQKACGVCDSCRLRLKGFKEAEESDPIPYA